MSSVMRAAAAVLGIFILLALSACADSSPAPSPSTSLPAPLLELSALAVRCGAQQAWWIALPQAEALRLIGDESWVDVSASPGPSAPTYVVLVRGDFEDASGKPCDWGVILPYGGGRARATTEATRPKVAGREWTPLALSSPQTQASP